MKKFNQTGMNKFGVVYNNVNVHGADVRVVESKSLRSDVNLGFLLV